MPTMTNTPPPVSDPAPADQDWFGGRRWTGIAAIGVFVLMAGALALVLLSPRHGTSTPKSTAPTAVVAPPVPPVTGGATTPTTATSTPTAVTTTAAVQLQSDVPTDAPAGTAWVLYDNVALPSVPGQGPSHVAGAIATGYAHTPVGALLAAANEIYRYRLADDGTWQAAAQAMCAPGPGAAAWGKVRSTHLYGAGSSSAPNFAQIAAFQFVTYTADDAVIQIVTRATTGALQVEADHVHWSGSDWQLVLQPPYGSSASNVQPVTSLDGFAVWTGV